MCVVCFRLYLALALYIMLCTMCYVLYVVCCVFYVLCFIVNGQVSHIIYSTSYTLYISILY